MNGEGTREDAWSQAELTMLTLARELEWAEAYAQDHRDCRMGRIYLDFLHWEMILAQGQA